MLQTSASFSKITPQHLAKLAYVYVRQSSLSQVNRYCESTEMQYHLVQRAIQLGWPGERVKVIDEDLGKSGSSISERLGFQQLIAEIGLGRVGLVLSLDASRLARNNRDWYQLLELCSLFGTLIADGENLYEPGSYHDRLLLGLSGMMSEAELHQLKIRLQAGERNKAARGELRQPLPVGLVRDGAGQVVFEPDEEVQARLKLVFDLFKRTASVRAVLRYLREHNLPLPARPLKGPAPHQLIWRPADVDRLMAILKNPAYAGAYVYGRTTKDPTRRKAGRPSSGIVRLPQEQWPVLLHNLYPAYLSWEEYLSNQQQITANRFRYTTGLPGAPKKGRALLQGLVVCGRCGARMLLHYSGTKSQFPVYMCQEARNRYGGKRCQEVRALGLDQAVEQLFLEALGAEKLELALAALEQIQAERTSLGQQWKLRLERANYEAERARRQYELVEPENRLVARNLERAWEERLRAAEQVEQAYQNWQQKNAPEMNEEGRQLILALAQDLPQVWHSATTTNAERKTMVRLLVERVIVDQHRQKGQIWFQINWQTGVISQHWLVRRVRSYDEYVYASEIEQRIRELVAAQKLDEEIASTLNMEGYQTAQLKPFTSKLIWMLRERWGIGSAKPNGFNPMCWEEGSYSVEGAAKAVGVGTGTILKWLRRGRLHGQQLTKGTPWKISLGEEEIRELQAYVARVRRSKKEAL